MTALAAPPPPSAAPPAPERPPLPAADGARRAVTVTARLLPEEIVAGRRLRALKKRLSCGLVLLVLLLVLAYALSWSQTSTARNDLSAEQNRGMETQQQLASFASLLSMQQQVAGTVSTLNTLMAGDIEWRTLLNNVRAAAPTGVVVAAINGAVSDPNASTSGPTGLQVLNASGQQDIGTLGITGTAPSKDIVAAYVDALGKVKGLAAPFPATVATSTSVVTFDLNVLITKSALSGRYTAPFSTGTGH